jgi:putative transposase
MIECRQKGEMTMPWKEENAMTLREEFVLKSLGRSVNFTKLCEEFEVSRKVGYKWVNRFKEGGLPALRDQSRRPHSCPDALAEHIVCEILRIKKQSPDRWGPKKIHALYERLHGSDSPTSLASVRRVMEKAGYVKRRRRRNTPPARAHESTTQSRPNELWTVDFKGWWKTRDGARCEPLTLRDGHSRFLLDMRGMESCSGDSLFPVFEKNFEIYGLPDVIRSDNGSPFASSTAPMGLSKLSAWWVSLGIRLDRIEPGRPDQNGAHERIHSDIRADLQLDPAGSLEQSQALFDEWRHTFNWERPHEALGMKFPGEVYERSKKVYTGECPEIEYPVNWMERRVSPGGNIKIHGRQIFISEALTEQVIGLEPVSDQLDVWFDYLRLGHTDLNTMKFIRVEGKKKKRRRPSYGRGPARTRGAVAQATGH